MSQPADKSKKEDGRVLLRTHVLHGASSSAGRSHLLFVFLH